MDFCNQLRDVNELEQKCQSVQLDLKLRAVRKPKDC